MHARRTDCLFPLLVLLTCENTPWASLDALHVCMWISQNQAVPESHLWDGGEGGCLSRVLFFQSCFFPHVASPNFYSTTEQPLEKEMATHFSILAWRTPWTEEPGKLHTVPRVARSWTQLNDSHSLTQSSLLIFF